MRRFAGVLMVMCLSSAVVVAAANGAPMTWDKGTAANGHQYELHIKEGGISWTAAKEAVARLEGGWHLATITSLAEQDWLVKNILAPQGGEGGYWLGGFQDPPNQRKASDGWRWVTGETWNYTSWVPGEPNDFWSPGSEQYLSIYVYPDVAVGQWNDEGEEKNVKGFLAERAGDPLQKPR